MPDYRTKSNLKKQFKVNDMSPIMGFNGYNIGEQIIVELNNDVLYKINGKFGDLNKNKFESYLRKSFRKFFNIDQAERQEERRQ